MPIASRLGTRHFKPGRFSRRRSNVRCRHAMAIGELDVGACRSQCVDERRRALDRRQQQRVLLAVFRAEKRRDLRRVVVDDGDVEVRQRRAQAAFVKFLAMARFDAFKPLAIIQLSHEWPDRFFMTAFEQAHHRGLARVVDILKRPWLAQLIQRRSLWSDAERRSIGWTEKFEKVGGD